MPRAVLWRRLDTTGTDFALVELGGAGLTARGVATAADPLPHSCRYELATDDGFSTSRLAVAAEGGGWRRQVLLEREGGRWRVTAEGHGELADERPGIEDEALLDAAFDVDLEATALTNTLPIRRLDLLRAPAGTVRTIIAAWVRVPSLQVVVAEQSYTVLGDGLIRYGQEEFRADLSIDSTGLVTHYPEYATLA